MTKRKSGTVNQELENAIAEELREVRKKHTADDGKHKKGDFVYSATDRMRVYDRALKLEQLKLGAGGADWGSAFNKPGDNDEG